jgi:hypothetical protein
LAAAAALLILLSILFLLVIFLVVAVVVAAIVIPAHAIAPPFVWHSFTIFLLSMLGSFNTNGFFIILLFS